MDGIECMFDGMRGTSIMMTQDQIESCAHMGECYYDVACVAALPEISAQLDAIGPDAIRAALKEVGAWDADELADDDANRLRAVWIAACDAKEEMASAPVDNSALHMTTPNDDGRHPEYSHLVMAEFERRHGSWIMTIKGHDGDALIGEDDFNAICGDDEFIRENEFGYIPDDYIDILNVQNQD